MNRDKRGDLPGRVMPGRSQSPHSTVDGKLSLKKVPILWHRRETRRKTEKTKGYLGRHPGFRIYLGFRIYPGFRDEAPSRRLGSKTRNREGG